MGHIGRRPITAYFTEPDATLAALIDNREGFALEDGFAGIPQFACLEDSLQSSIKADIFCVCTPNYLHHPHTLAGLHHGMHVVCEKPMALEVAHCNEMIAAAEAADRHIFCVMQNRYSPPAV